MERLNKELMWHEPFDELRFWVRMYYDAVKSQVQMNRFTLNPNNSEVMDKAFTVFRDEILTVLSAQSHIKGRCEYEIERIVKTLPEWEWAKGVPGVGAISLGKLLGLTGCPAARELVSNLQRFCGLAVIGGKIEKAGKGEVRHYNCRAKAQLFLIVCNALKAYAKTPNLYGEVYYQYRQRFEQKHPDWSKLHCHLAAVLKVGRLFISHLWEVSRRAHGLEARRAYPIEVLGHVTYIPPEMALHPAKYSDEVAAAINEFVALLPAEPDDELKELHERIAAVLKSAVVPAAAKRKKR